VAVDQAWNRAKGLWQEAQELRRRGPDAPWAGWFSQRLLSQVLGWDDLTPCPPRPIEAALFPITHQAFAGAVPVVLTGLGNDELDKGQAQFGQDGRRRSPHSCLQECLNADDSSNWGLLCNGTSLRLLHDNPALEAVGQGLLQHPANGELVAQLQSGELSTQAFFRQLLRLVYRLLFLCVAEDRDLLFAPEVPPELRQIYREGYSLSRLRDLAIRSGAHEQQHGVL
jgi:hypothetical protein